MTAEQWRRALTLLQQLEGLSPEERRSQLQAVSTDPEVLHALLKRLEESDSSGSAWSTPSHPEQPWLLSGYRVGRYVLVACIGRGGMGEVWSAQDEELDRLVALKFLRRDSGEQGRSDRHLREARAASALNHPNIVTIYEAVWDRDAPVIVMEWVDGVSLRALTGTPVALERVVGIGQQVAQALAACHARGIVHRDLKPENVLLREDGYVKVVDFGLAHSPAGELSLSLSLAVGTLRYMSPEQTRDEQVSTASDIFSLGLLLYELATGQHAFPADSAVAAACAIATVRPAPPSALGLRCPGQFDELLLSMLARDPALRPSANEVVRALGECIRAPDEKRAASRNLRWRIAAVTGALTGVVALAWFSLPPQSPRAPADFPIVPLTAQSGWERSPAISPDGQDVAFTWTGTRDQPAQIYVKRFGDDPPEQLTEAKRKGDIGPLVWSPDGKRIAFKRDYGDDGGIHVIPSGGGEETKVLNLRVADLSSGIDWSPDGTQLIFSDMLPDSARNAIYSYTLQTGEKRKLTSPPPGKLGDWDPRYSPDGARIAFKRVTAFWVDDIYIVPAAGGLPTQVTSDQGSISGHDWMPDGRSLVVSSQRHGVGFSIWRLPLNKGGRPERITSGTADAVSPTACRTRNRIAWVNRFENLNLYRAPVNRRGPPEKLIASAVNDQGGAFSPDSRIAFLSDRTGSRELWISRADGSMPMRVTDFKGAALGGIQWSRDGRQLAFDGQLHRQPDIFILDCPPGAVRCGEPRRLTTEESSELAPTWSADGAFVYFASNRGGQWDVWKQPADGGAATQVTHGRGYLAVESHDGKWIYFSRPERSCIWRMPGPKQDKGGDEELVVGPPYSPLVTDWALGRDSIVFEDNSAPGNAVAIRAYDIALRKTRTILQAPDLASDNGMSISADGRWVLYSRLDKSGSNVVVSDLSP